jgi:ribulose-5-phosphate 4-epimerase/fuculose-1-phosphate aldolase
MNAVLKPSNPLGVSAEEWHARQQLAGCYRLFEHFGWHELIYNHITVRVPGEAKHYLINPFGLRYDEITASNLLKADIHGNVLSKSDYGINKAGFTIHAALHGARDDAHAVMHTHSTAGQAVACSKEGLLPMSFTALMFHEKVAYHDYQGITVDLEEQASLLADMGTKNIMILRNHGLLVCGASLADAFADMHRLQRSCEVQVALTAGGMTPLLPDTRYAVKATQQFYSHSLHSDENQLLYDAMMRLMVKKDPSFLE